MGRGWTYFFTSSVLACQIVCQIACQSILGIEDTVVGTMGTGSFSITLLSSQVSVPLDGKRSIEIEIERVEGFGGEVTIQAMNPPAGVEASEIIVPGEQNIVQFPIGGRAPLAIGDTLTVTIVAATAFLPPPSAEQSSQRSITIEDMPVTGRPGAPDATFGSGATGFAVVSFGADRNGGFFHLQVDPGATDTSVVALGTGLDEQGPTRLGITRLTASGQLDTEFASGTLVRDDFGSGSSAENTQAVAGGFQADGQFIAIGWHSAGVSVPPDMALLRFRPDGSPGDNGFGNGGKALIDLGGQEKVADGLVLPDNSILLVGERDGQLLLARATAAGELDTSFAAPDGFQTIELGTASAANALATDSQGRILVAGSVTMNDQSDMLLLRFTADGQLDTSFGSNGQVLAGSLEASERAVALAVTAGEQIVMAGESDRGGNIDFEIRRFIGDGTPDMSFATMGVANHTISPDDDRTTDVLPLANGQILVAGNRTLETGTTPILARYTRTGELDPHFGANGVLELFIGNDGMIQTLLAHASHRVLVGGGTTRDSPGPDAAGVVVRLWM